MSTGSGPENPDNREGYELRFAPGLSEGQRAEAERIFAALRATRRERRGRADEVAADGDPADSAAAALPLCPVLLLSGEPCLLPLVDEHDCPHRAPGPAPAALAAVVTELRREVAEARAVASRLGAAVRYLRGDSGVDAVLKREQPWWLVPGESEWPPA